MLFSRIGTGCAKVEAARSRKGGTDLAWDEHGYYEVALDANSLTLTPSGSRDSGSGAR